MDESGELWCTAQNEFGMDKTSRLIIVKHRKFNVIYFTFNKRQTKTMWAFKNEQYRDTGYIKYRTQSKK